MSEDVIKCVHKTLFYRISYSLFGCLSVCLRLSFYLCFYLSIFLSFYLSVFLSSCLSIYLSIFLSLSIYIYLSVYLSICFSVYLPSYLSIRLSIPSSAYHTPPSFNLATLPHFLHFPYPLQDQVTNDQTKRSNKLKMTTRFRKMKKASVRNPTL